MVRAHGRGFDGVYHILQTENPAFCTALNLQIGAVHTELDLSMGEPTGEGYQNNSLEALIVRARKRVADKEGPQQPLCSPYMAYGSAHA